MNGWGSISFCCSCGAGNPATAKTCVRCGADIAKSADDLARKGLAAKPGKGILGLAGHSSTPAATNAIKMLESMPAQVQKIASLCVYLQAVPVATPLPVAASKYGGVPYMEDEGLWPLLPTGEAMTFVGQINFREIRGILEDAAQLLPHEFPQEGILAFFYDTDKQPWGYDPADRARWRFRWYPTVDDTEAPVKAPTQPYLPRPCRLIPSLGTSLPSYGGAEYSTLDLADDEEADYDDLREVIAPRPCHQLLGFPGIIQNDPSCDAQLASNGVYCGDPASIAGHPQAAILEKGYGDWRLLWQVDTDEEGPGFLWGDCGRLFIMIRKEDLLGLRMDNLWPVLQCY